MQGFHVKSRHGLKVFYPLAFPVSETVLSSRIPEEETMSKRRSPCPLACTLDIIGDKWTLLVIRDMSFGRTQFKEFCESPEGIATNILSDRLTKLVDWGLAEKYILSESPCREGYRLTVTGESLRPVLNAIVKWGLENIEGTASLMKSHTSSINKGS